MRPSIQNIDKNYARFVSDPASAVQQKAKQMRDTFAQTRARRAGREEMAAGLQTGSGAGATVGKVLLAGFGIAAVIGATVGITKFSSQILSSIGGLGAHGGIVAGVFVGIAFLLTGIVSAVAIMKKAQQVKALRAENVRLNQDLYLTEEIAGLSEQREAGYKDNNGRTSP